MAAVHHVCEELRLVRIEQGLTLRDLGLNVASVSEWERGRHSPRLDKVAEWAAALGYDIVLRARPTGEPPALTAPVDLMAALRASFERIKAAREASAAEQAHDDLQAELAEDARREYAAEREAE
jgi:transcriptional regulator with XRE-family HTH domain